MKSVKKAKVGHEKVRTKLMTVFECGTVCAFCSFCTSYYSSGQ